jgi:N-acetylneuraminate synthase
MGDQVAGLTRHGGVLVIGEVGQAHDGSLGTAHAYIDAIADAGADAVKFQTHIADAESSADEPWRVKFSRQDVTRYDYWKRMQFTTEQWLGLKEHADERKLLFLSSPFSLEAVRLLSGLGIKAWKLASGEINNIPLVDAMVASQLPVLASTGMSTLNEIDQVVERLKASSGGFALLQCSSTYPTPPDRIGLNVVSELRDRYQCKVGLSDHSGTIFPSLAAVTLGASIIEVHVVLSRKSFGPDVSSSVTDQELGDLVKGIRMIETALSSPVDKSKIPPDLVETKRTFGRSIVFERDLQAGHTLLVEDLSLKKPGNGLGAEHLTTIIGRKLRRSVSKGQRASEEDFS